MLMMKTKDDYISEMNAEEQDLNGNLTVVSGKRWMMTAIVAITMNWC